MDSFEINKIVASILLIALLFIGIGKISDLVFKVDKPDTPGYKVEIPESGLAKQASDTKENEVEKFEQDNKQRHNKIDKRQLRVDTLLSIL